MGHVKHEQGFHEMTHMKRVGIWAGASCLLLITVVHATQPSSPMDVLYQQTQAVTEHLPSVHSADRLPPGFQHFTLPTTHPSATVAPEVSPHSRQVIQDLDRTLDRLNNALISQAHGAGLLRQAPRVHTVPVTGAEVEVLSGMQAQTVISSAWRPEVKLLDDPGTKVADPVLLRWFVLLHEAAHTELGEIHSPFINPDWDPKTNQAMSDLMFDPGRLGDQTFGVFDETFGDVYAALMLVRLAPADHALAAKKTIEGVRNLRTVERHTRMPLVLDSLFDPHSQVDGLGILVGKLTEPDFLGWLHTATPYQLIQEALWETSDSVTTWLRTDKPRFQDDFGWAKAHPENLKIGRITAELRLVNFRRRRALSYVLDPSADPHAAQAQTFGSPLFQAQLSQDGVWHANFTHDVSSKTRADLRAFIRGVGDQSSLQRPDFRQWLQQTTQAQLGSAVIARDQAWLDQRYQQVYSALKFKR